MDFHNDTVNNNLSWSATYKPSVNRNLPGDKVLLPPTALSDLLVASTLTEPDPNSSSDINTNKSLPQPLTFRLKNPRNDNVVYAGVREFSAPDGEIIISHALTEALGITSTSKSTSSDLSLADIQKLIIISHQLPKGTFVKLRPIESGYDFADWKALLENYLRTNNTTLTKGQYLTVPSPEGNFRFLIDQLIPDEEAVCIVDTDLEVDIEPLDEDQARDTIKKLAIKDGRLPITSLSSSSKGGSVNLFDQIQGHIVSNDYIDYELFSWDKTQALEITLTPDHDQSELDLYVNVFGPRQRLYPRHDYYHFADYDSHHSRRIVIDPTHDYLKDAESIRISIHSYTPVSTSSSKVEHDQPHVYSLFINPYDVSSEKNTEKVTEIQQESVSDNDIRCQNCLKYVPKATLILHENFCLRNNTKCLKCSQVFLKSSEEWKSHWHCSLDTCYGNTFISKEKHDLYCHTTSVCNACNTYQYSIEVLAKHKINDCSEKLILCQFCHLQVPQGDFDPLASIQGLTSHELVDGGRTTECHLCSKIVRLRDMKAHMAHHEFSKLTRLSPKACANILCGYTQDGANKNGNTRVHTNGQNRKDGQGNLALCPKCFGPLYVSLHDPEGIALRSRIERRYLQQIIKGCNKPWCVNDLCKTGRSNLGEKDLPKNIKEALPLIQPIMKQLKEQADQTDSTKPVEMKFCVDETSQSNKSIAEMLAGHGAFTLDWCIAAMEAGQTINGANEWLNNWAPKKSM